MIQLNVLFLIFFFPSKFFCVSLFISIWNKWPARSMYKKAIRMHQNKQASGSSICGTWWYLQANSWINVGIKVNVMVTLARKKKWNKTTESKVDRESVSVSFGLVSMQELRRKKKTFFFSRLNQSSRRIQMKSEKKNEM